MVVPVWRMCDVFRMLCACAGGQADGPHRQLPLAPGCSLTGRSHHAPRPRPHPPSLPSFFPLSFFPPPRDVFLRELVSNASDALDKVRLLALQDAAEFKTGSGERGVLCGGVMWGGCATAGNRAAVSPA